MTAHGKVDMIAAKCASCPLLRMLKEHPWKTPLPPHLAFYHNPDRFLFVGDETRNEIIRAGGGIKWGLILDFERTKPHLLSKLRRRCDLKEQPDEPPRKRQRTG